MSNVIGELVSCGSPLSVSLDAQYLNDSAFIGRENLTGVDCPNAIAVGERAFEGCVALSDAYFPSMVLARSSAFNGCTSLNMAMSQMVNAEAYAFHNARITDGNFPSLVAVGERAFGALDWQHTMGSGVSVISLANARYIGNYAFLNWDDVEEVYLPNAVHIGDYAFATCSSLRTVYAPNAVTLGSGAFAYCRSLSDISMPNVVVAKSYAFEYCDSLSTVNLPKLEILGREAFCDGSVRTITADNLRYIGYKAFSIAVYLKTASFPKLEVIAADAFNQATNFTSLYLGGSSVCRLLSSTAFAMTSYSLSIYVPSSLYSAYRMAPGWYNISGKIKSYAF